MRRGLLLAAIGLVAVAGIAGLGAAAVSLGFLNGSLDDVRRAYVTAESRFVTIDGVEMHVLDQGTGPAIVLLHGNLGSHRMWDRWAEDLREEYRVIRFDSPGHGLTGPDTRVDEPGEAIDRGVSRLELLLDELGVDRFVLVGTSFSGIIAFRMAARSPDRVRGLVLINSGGLPRDASTNPNRRRVNPLSWWIHGYYFSRSRMAEALDTLTGPAYEPSTELIDEYFSMQNIRGRQQEKRIGAERYTAGDVYGTLASITVPTRVVWGKDNRLLPQSEGEALVAALKNAPAQFDVYPGTGHLLPIEAAERGVADLRAFVAGLDGPGPVPESAGASFRECDDCPLMVVVPAGSFTMGFDGGEPERYEGPVRQVEVARKFAVGRYPVTNAQYRVFQQDTGHPPSGCWMWDGRNARFDKQASWQDPGYGRPPGDAEPAACLNWKDANAYVTWLAKRTGQPYRLPSETEWEYLAWGGERRGRFAWGDRPEDACLHANVFDRSSAAAAPDSPLEPAACDDGYPDIAPVGQFRANAFGVYDIIGNIWEWQQDCYVMPYAADAPRDGSPHILPGAACERRSVRGGSWNTGVERQRPTFRGRDPEDLSSQVFGLRVARDLVSR